MNPNMLASRCESIPQAKRSESGSGEAALQFFLSPFNLNRNTYVMPNVYD